MKIIKLSILLLILPMAIKSQNIQNASFDSVYIGGIDRLFGWISSDAWGMNINGDTVLPMQPNHYYQAVGLSLHEVFNTVQLEYAGATPGGSAVRLYSKAAYIHDYGYFFPGFIVNGNHFYTDNNGYIDLIRCGEPFPFRPDKLKGYYKFEDSLSVIDNYGVAEVILKKYNTSTNQIDTIGYAHSGLILNPTLNWTPFEINIDYYDNVTPDSIIVAFYSSAFGPRTTFWIDDISFDYYNAEIEHNLKEKINIFPNPTEGSIYINSVEKDFFIEVFATNGESIAKYRNRNEINLSELERGLYIICIEKNNAEKSFHKIIRL